MSLPQETTRKIKDLLFQRYKERHWDEYLAWHRQQAGSSQDVSTSSRHQSDSTPAEDAAVTNLIKGRFELCYRYLKRVPGGYSAFQGSHGPSKDGSNWWDAGVAYEVRQYGPLLAAQDARYTNMAGMVSLRQQAFVRAARCRKPAQPEAILQNSAAWHAQHRQHGSTGSLQLHACARHITCRFMLTALLPRDQQHQAKMGCPQRSTTCQQSCSISCRISAP